MVFGLFYVKIDNQLNTLSTKPYFLALLLAVELVMGSKIDQVYTVVVQKFVLNS